MSKKKSEHKKQLLKSRKDLKEIKLVRQMVKHGIAGAADKLQALVDARVLRNAVKSPLQQAKMTTPYKSASKRL